MKKLILTLAFGIACATTALAADGCCAAKKACNDQAGSVCPIKATCPVVDKANCPAKKDCTQKEHCEAKKQCCSKDKMAKRVRIERGAALLAKL
jgi:hypothetical protein